MATLNKKMLREYWSRREAMTNLKFGFDFGVLLQCDFRLDVKRGNDIVMTSDTWVMDSASLAPSQLTWGYDAETFGSPLPTFSNQPCSITFLTKGQNPLDNQDNSVGLLLTDLYALQFDSQTGLLALPHKHNKLSFVFSLMGTIQDADSFLNDAIAAAEEAGNNELAETLSGGSYKKAAKQADKIEDDQLLPFVLFELSDVKIGTPIIQTDPKSMTPMGVKVDFVYRNSQWRDFAGETKARTNTSFKLTTLQSDDDSIHTVKLGESSNQ